ncbi:hypothetical protein [Cupriavidus campinensis]|uniref:Uncharacterized protein n=1 Tax=Cupriavidus campinensis TaxID=151783 RepID=A0ABY3EST2_9BURK|nr:hypothetical protein [Cupriavidus campinensis]TSP14034.1 hypothetical protein FGG12_06070 [Cupriavidus campinensis]
MKYFDRTGASIPPEKWQEHRADTEYVDVRKFDNHAVRIGVEWVGKCKDRDALYAYLVPIFKLIFQTNVDGRWISDPTDGKTFATEKEAIKAYDDAVVRWTESERDDDGNVVEVGNIYTPPDLDAPTVSDTAISTVSTGDDDVGVW